MTHVLVVGRGGREHAIAWKLAQSPRVTRISVAPGNGGTEAIPIAQNLDIDATDVVSLLDFAETSPVDMTIVGPEEPLAGGLVDQFDAVGLPIFGPPRRAAMIEVSKSFAKDLMLQHGIPTAPYELFSDLDTALDYTNSHPVDEIVIKADGLARGKGVFLPKGASDAEGILRALLERDALGPAGRSVLIERRISGHELTVMAFTDGRSLAMMPAVREYKRLRDQGQGPNTGGMGAYAPAPALTPEIGAQVRLHIIEPLLAALNAGGCCFRGVLNVGIVLTPGGPLALELNARFGDPGAQAVLPLLETDLLSIVDACITGTLDELPVRWQKAAAVTIVLATASYPHHADPGLPVIHPNALPDDVLLFHAGTRTDANHALLTTGGRVLDVTGLGHNLGEAMDRAYDVLGGVHFEGLHFRTDIAAPRSRFD